MGASWRRVMGTAARKRWCVKERTEGEVQFSDNEATSWLVNGRESRMKRRATGIVTSSYRRV